MIEILKIIIPSFSRKNWRQFVILNWTIIITGVCEGVTVGIIYPAIKTLLHTDKLNTAKELNFHDSQFDVLVLNDFMPNEILSMAVILILITCVIRIVNIYKLTNFAFNLGADLSIKIFKKSMLINTLNIPHSEIVSAIALKTHSLVYFFIYPIVNITSGAVLGICICSTMFYLAPGLTFTLCVLLLLVYFIIGALYRKMFYNNSLQISKSESKIMLILNETFLCIKEIRLYGLEKIILEKYSKNERTRRTKQAENLIVSQAPRFIIESLGMLGLIGFLLLIQNPEERSTYLASTAMIVVGLQRLMPILQSTYLSYSKIRSNYQSILDSVIYLNKTSNSETGTNRVSTEFNEVNLINVCFSYHAKQPILNNVNLKINKGEKIALVGKTGSGKSTLTQILMGFLNPTTGHILVNKTRNIKFNKNPLLNMCAYVPQKIFLFNDTLLFNICLKSKLNKKEEKLLYDILKICLITDFGLTSEALSNAIVCENGNNYSGGQQQRIGIARALFSKRPVLILDEATNALDAITEHNLLKNLVNFRTSLTIIMITHNSNNLKFCDSTYKLENNTTNFHL